MKPETAFKLQIMPQLLKIPESYWVKIQQMTIRGTPDIFGVKSSTSVILELKMDEFEEADPLQLHNIAKARAAGAYARVVHPKIWPLIYKEICLL